MFGWLVEFCITIIGEIKMIKLAGKKKRMFDFGPKSPFISETVRDRATVTESLIYEVIGTRSICVGFDDLG